MSYLTYQLFQSGLKGGDWVSPIGRRRVWTSRSTEAGSDKAAVPQMTSVVFWRRRDKILSGLYKVQTIFIMMLKHVFSYCVDMWTDGAKATLGKPAGAYAKIRIVAPNCTSSHWISYHQILKIKENKKFKTVSFKNVFNEAVKNNRFSKKILE